MGLIDTKKLTFEYIRRDEEGNVEGITKAVDEIDLEVKQGEFIAILGHNGSGKSTLAKHINAILYPTEGEVLKSDLILSIELARAFLCSFLFSEIRKTSLDAPTVLAQAQAPKTT